MEQYRRHQDVTVNKIRTKKVIELFMGGKNK